MTRVVGSNSCSNSSLSHPPAADTDPAVVAPPLVPAQTPSTDAAAAIDHKAFDDLVSSR